MNEEPKSIWKKPRHGMRSYLLAWLAVLTIAPVIFAIFTLATQTSFTHAEFGLLLFFEVFVSHFVFVRSFSAMADFALVGGGFCLHSPV